MNAPARTDRARVVRDVEARRHLRELLAASSFGCPRSPISCGHMLSDHLGAGVDDDGNPADPACTVPGCDCDGVS